MPSWSSPSPDLPPDAEAAEQLELLRRFVEASRRAEIVALVNSARSEGELGEVVTDELCEAFEAEIAFLVAEPGGGAPPVAWGATGLVGDQREALLHDPLIIRTLVGEHQAAVHTGADLLAIGVRGLVLQAFAGRGGGRAVLGVGRLYDEPFDPAEIALLRAVAEATGYALERFWLAAHGARRAAGQAALARAARSLNASLERDDVLDALCKEVAGALDADVVNVYFGDAQSGLVAVASHGAGPEFVGFRRAPGEGLGGRAVRTGRPQVSNAYDAEGHGPATTAALRDVRAALSVPLHRHARIDGALSVGFRRDRWIDQPDVELVEAFAELASTACRNAEEHADVRRAAMSDPLTGCLNHGAFQTLLREEIARAERGEATGEPDGLSLALVDLHDFKSVNERYGHPAGDELLRTVGGLLRGAIRPGDRVARYGGDEFALLMPGGGEETADAVTERVRAAMAGARRPEGRRLGIAISLVAWSPGEDATELLERADLSLRAAKQEARDGPASEAPAPARRESSAARRADLRARRLAAAGRIGGRLARLLDMTLIAEMAVNELQTSLGADLCRLVRLHDDGYVSAVAVAGRADPGETGWSQPQDEGAIGRCLRERRPVLRPAGTPGGPGWELATPVSSGGTLWGAVHVRAIGEDALAGEDSHFVESVCDHLGAALHTADLYRRLDQAYLGTAEALAAALEAKDDYTADHARSIADLAVAVGRELDLDEEQLRDIRYGAIFHDIGKIAIPDSILNKPGPLTDQEIEVIKTHPIAGEQILAPVPFLARVRRIVRHDHERWDGTGYPDGLRGPQIPIGARIVLVVDAYHAMVSDRPYRRAMPPAEARDELSRNAGTQFDPAVVEAFLRVLGGA